MSCRSGYGEQESLGQVEVIVSRIVEWVMRFRKCAWVCSLKLAYFPDVPEATGIAYTGDQLLQDGSFQRQLSEDQVQAKTPKEFSQRLRGLRAQ